MNRRHYLIGSLSVALSSCATSPTALLQPRPRKTYPIPGMERPGSRGLPEFEIPAEDRDLFSAHGAEDEYAKNELLNAPDRTLADRETPIGMRADLYDWRPAESLLALRAQVNKQAPSRSKTHDGMIGDGDHQNRNSDHNPWVIEDKVGVVTAYDITHDPGDGCDCEKIAKSLVESQDPRIKYIIWNHRIINRDSVKGVPAWTWRRYGGRNPHDMHIHISVLPTKRLYDLGRPWNVQFA